MAYKFSSTFMLNEKNYSYEYGTKGEFDDVDCCVGLFDDDCDYSSRSSSDCENSVFGDGFID